MKKRVLFLLFGSFLLLRAQSFTVEHGNLTLSDTVGSEIIFNFTLTNNSGTDLTVDFIRVKNDLPESWSSSLCFTLCFAPFVDSVSTTADFGSSPIAPNESRNLSVHVFPISNEGTANLTVVIKNHNAPNEQYSFDLTATTETNGVEEISTPGNFYLSQNYPNPFGKVYGREATSFNIFVPRQSFVSLKVFNVLGKEVATLINATLGRGKYKAFFDAKDLPSGVYFAVLKANNYKKVRKILMEK